jgi:hypothetical protein
MMEEHLSCHTDDVATPDDLLSCLLTLAATSLHRPSTDVLFYPPPSSPRLSIIRSSCSLRSFSLLPFPQTLTCPIDDDAIHTHMHPSRQYSTNAIHRHLFYYCYFTPSIPFTAVKRQTPSVYLAVVSELRLLPQQPQNRRNDNVQPEQHPSEGHRPDLHARR